MQLDETALVHAVARSVEVKAEVVAEDERETTGLRAFLNLGHTFGHAEELLSGYGVILHGEAVSAGMVAAARVAELKGWWSLADVERLKSLLQRCKLPLELKATEPFDAFWQAMLGDKKAEGGLVKFIIPRSIGTCEPPLTLDREFIQRSLSLS